MKSMHASSSHVRQPRPPPAPSTGTGLYDRASAYISKMDAAISGSGGHNATFAVARALRGWLAKGLPESQCIVLFDEYNRRCEPPLWDERETSAQMELFRRRRHGAGGASSIDLGSWRSAVGAVDRP